MQYNKIHNTDLEVSPITLGTWVLGGAMWGGAKQNDGIEAVHLAIDKGINMIDTAPIYGNGVSEQIVGKAIKGRREKIVIATKCGLIPQGKKVDLNLKAESIFKECEDSLRRLSVDYIDIYQCHWPDKSTPIEETIGALKQLKDQGKIRYIGLSNHNVDQFKEALKHSDIITAQDQYSMLDRTVEEILLPFLKERNIGLLAYGPLAGGILTGKYAEEPHFAKGDCRQFFYKYYQGPKFEEVSSQLEKLKQLGHPLNELAINWVRQQEGVASVLVGCRNAQQMEQNISALSWKLSDKEFEQIKEIIS